MQNLSFEKTTDQENYLSTKQNNKEKKNIFTPVELIYISSLLSQNDPEDKSVDENIIIDNLEY